MSSFILAHDIGTSGNKASLFDAEGKLLSSGVYGYETEYPRRGWAEQNPGDWWNAFCLATRKALEGKDKNEVAAVCVSGQMMGCLPLSKDGEPLAESIIWSDARAEAEAGYLSEKLGREDFYRITGQPFCPNYTLPKILWFRKHYPGLFKRTDCFIQAKDYINYRLTGEKATDPTDASYTAAYDINKMSWSEKILDAVRLSSAVFPKVHACGTVIGTVTKRAAEECGLAAGTPVFMGAGDGSAAHLGGGSISPGDAYICLGSSSWVMSTTESLIWDPQKRMQTELHVIDGKYAYLGTMQTGGAAYSWSGNALSGGRLSYPEIDALAALSVPGANGTLFLPHLMGERSPWPDPGANAAFLGLRQDTAPPQLYRAVMEGVAFNLDIILKIIRKSVCVKEIAVIGGGAKSRIWRQIFADVTGMPILLPEHAEERTGIGAAIIAGVGCGLYPDYSAARKFLHIKEITEPRKDYSELYRELEAVFEDAYRALSDVNHRISGLSKASEASRAGII
ncbi:MAG: xylulokinase [Bacillota bacterium]|nr:xylulokinase [Bacillota bacterium]